MANHANPLQPAIDALEKDLADVERRENELRSALKLLRAKAGLPTPPDAGGPDSGGGTPPPSPPSGEKSPATTQIRPDSFFGKRMGSAARQYLEMRKAAGGDGPAKPRDIFEALRQGGFQFETKDDTVAVISLRNMLRKRSETFQRLPNGTYGLRAWYPHAKPPKAASGDEDKPDRLGADTPDAEDDIAAA